MLNAPYSPLAFAGQASDSLASPAPLACDRLGHVGHCLAAVFNVPALYRLLTSHVPYLISIFWCLGRARESVHFLGPCKYFATHIFYGEGLLALAQTPKLEGHPLSAVRNCLFNIFAATLHIWRPSPLSAT
jgi:hypothetical protein